MAFEQGILTVRVEHRDIPPQTEQVRDLSSYRVVRAFEPLRPS